MYNITWNNSFVKPENNSEILVKLKPEGANMICYNNPETLYVAGIYHNEPYPNGDDDIFITVFDSEDIKIYDFENEIEKWIYIYE